MDEELVARACMRRNGPQEFLALPAVSVPPSCEFGASRDKRIVSMCHSTPRIMRRHRDSQEAPRSLDRRCFLPLL